MSHTTIIQHYADICRIEHWICTLVSIPLACTITISLFHQSITNSQFHASVLKWRMACLWQIINNESFPDLRLLEVIWLWRTFNCKLPKGNFHMVSRIVRQTSVLKDWESLLKFYFYPVFHISDLPVLFRSWLYYYICR